MKRSIAMLTAITALIALPTLASARPGRGKAVRNGHGRVHAKVARKARRARTNKRFVRGTRYAPAKRYYRGRRYRKAPYNYRTNRRYNRRTNRRYNRRYRRPIRRVRVAPVVPRRVKKARFCYANPRSPICRSYRY